MTGGNSAVRVLDSTACSTVSSPSTLFDVKPELDRRRVEAWLSVRFRVRGIGEETLPRWRIDACRI